MRALAAMLLCLAAASLHAATIRNDDSCDIALLPSATLLLPYFEVDITSAAGTGETTIFTVTNTTNLPQAVQVTLWTEFDYPVMAFNLFLTGYDVQSINLYDVIRRGQIAPEDGTGFDVSNVGERSGDPDNDIPFDNTLLAEQTCVDLPVGLPVALVTRMQSAFTTGKVPALGTSAACNTAGLPHANAVGYATIDVVGACRTTFPTETTAYFDDLIRFDNVLTGDYAQVNGNEDFAQGGPMVHIRAIPEGGTAQSRSGKPEYRVDAPRTFYSRFQSPSTPKLDARQPLPSTFAARWISGGATGFETFYKIWREGRTTAGTACSALPARAQMGIVEMVRFDEEENPEIHVGAPIIGLPIPVMPILPSTSLTSIEDQRVYPPMSFGNVSGWTYLNLDNNSGDEIASQNWVISSMRAEDRFSIDADSVALGNGCSAPRHPLPNFRGFDPIGPAPNGRP